MARAPDVGDNRRMMPTAIGSYPILRVLGEGATGLVYAGQDPALRREVAIKVLRQGVGEKVEQRFVREGRLLAKLRHPGVVGVHSVGSHAGRPYLVMDLLVGSSLEERLSKDGAYTWGEAVELTLSLADALSYAHGEGVWHRDLKPENVVLNSDGRPILTDFGLGKALDTTTQVSVEGGLLGTPAYWAPEQARGDLQAIGPATDVYGVGGILYALLTGEGPNRGLSLAELVTSMQVDPPAPSRAAPGALPKSLDAICLRALARSPKDRFRSMEEFREALAELAHTAPKRSVLPWALAALAGLAALGLGLDRARSAEAPQQSASATPTLSLSPQPTPTPAPSQTPIQPRPSQTPAPSLPPALSAEEAGALEKSLSKLARGKKNDEALALAETLTKGAPTRPYAYAIRGSILFERGQSEEAFLSYVDACKQSPGDASLELGLISAALRFEQVHLRRLARLVKVPDPRLQSSALLTRALLYHQRGAIYAAINDYRAYLRLQPKDKGVFEKYALALFDAREFKTLRTLLSKLEPASQGAYLFALGEFNAGSRVLAKSNKADAVFWRAACGGQALASRVPAGLNQDNTAIYRYLTRRETPESLVKALGANSLSLPKAHCLVGLYALTRGDLSLARTHFEAAQASSVVPSLERSMARWYGSMLRRGTSAFRDAPQLGPHWRKLLELGDRPGQMPTASAFETDLLLEVYPEDATLLKVNARNVWGLRAGLALSRLISAARLAKGTEVQPALRRLATHLMTLRRWADCELTCTRALTLGESPNLRGRRGGARLALRMTPEAIADLEASLAAAPSRQGDVSSSLAGAYLLAGRDEDALNVFGGYQVGPKTDANRIALNLLLAGWAVGRPDVWRAQLKAMKPGPIRGMWGFAMGQGAGPPREFVPWWKFVLDKMTWDQAGLPSMPPGSTTMRVASGVYFAARGKPNRAREQFEIALRDLSERTSLDTIIASRWLADHPK